MGIDLTKQLFARHAAALTAGELVVLGYMCVVALDKENGKGQTARLYFGGWEPLALALGYDGLTDAAKTKVKRAVRSLREKGLIKPLIGHAQTGERQVYRIRVGETGGHKQTPYRGSDVDPQEGVRIRPDRGSHADPPRTDTGGGEDLLQDIELIEGAQVQTATGSIDKHKFRGRPGDDCTECGAGYSNRTAHPMWLIQQGTA